MCRSLLGGNEREVDWEQREGYEQTHRAWPIADGEKGEAGKTGELTGKHLAFKHGPGFILWSVGSC